ncbi:MAG: hypothetical protein KC589_11170, partial [Nanoarchaeota archaeon]|nr:hypothetical protein [Nanoarchaeota archaeon]
MSHFPLNQYSESTNDLNLNNIGKRFSEINEVIESIVANLNTNLLLLLPEETLNSISIIGKNYSDLNNKDVLIISNENNIIKHYKDYQYLSNFEGSSYMFLSTIPILLIENSSEVKIYNKRIKKKDREAYSS